MSFRYPAGLITAGSPVVPQYPTGVWTNQQAMPYINGQVWAQDPYFQNTTLLLHGDGANGTNNAQLSAFVDNSTNNFPITVNGDSYADNFSPFSVPAGYWSNFFDGTGDFLSVPSNAAFDLGSSNFTIEAWVYPTVIKASNVGFPIISRYASGIGWVLRIVSSTTLRFVRGNDVVLDATGLSISENAWSHVVVSRNSGNLSIFLNGIRVAAATGIANFSDATTTTVQIGRTHTLTDDAQGYISNARVVKGTAVYDPTSTTITVPTAPLTAISGTSLLTCQSNRFVDNSSNNFAITRNGDVTVSPFTPFTVTPNTTDGSGYFDGSGDFLFLDGGAPLTFGTGDFTIEFWANLPAAQGSYPIDFRGSGQNGAYPTVLFTSNSFRYVVNSTTVITGSAINYNSWNHIAICRSGTSTKMFLNGVQTGSTWTDTTNYLCGTSRPTIGQNGNNTGAADWFSGYLSNIRILKGTALYTSDFSVPTAPLTAITNTQLLTCQYQGNVSNNGFVDSGPYDFRITRNGNTTQGSFSPFSKPDGRWGNYFDGSGDNLRIADSTAFDLAGDFKIECWAYITVLSSNQSIWTLGSVNASQNGLAFYWAASSVNKLRLYSNGGVILTGSTTLSANTWYHLAVVRSGSTLTLYVNGVSDGTATNSTSFTGLAGNGFAVGNEYTTSFIGEYAGYISNLRLVKGTAITPPSGGPTSPLTAVSGTELLTCQSNRFIDNSTNNFTITRNGDVRVTPFSPFPITTAYDPAVNGGSGYFDGSGDYLTVPDNAALDFGTGDFTIQFWVWFAATPTGDVVLLEKRPSLSAVPWIITADATNGGTVYFYDGTVRRSSIAITPRAWQHYAFTRSSGTLKIFVNGVEGFSGSVTTNLDSAGQLVIAARADFGVPFTGYMSGLQLLKGTGYTSFSIPTAPPTAIANTSLLCNFTNAGIFDNTGFNNLDTVGNAQIDTSVKKYGTGAMKFDGSGDRLLIPSSPNTNPGAGDFTIEGWIYFNNFASGFPQFYSIATGSVNWQFAFSSSTMYVWNGSSNIISSSFTWATGTWYHVAWSRSNGTLRQFVNGTQIGSVSSTFNFTEGSINVGSYQNGLSNGDLNGYIDDLRITKGIARYTTTFTPPIARFPNQ